ncbi:hypothetical protein A3B57_01685 [Microgenomates group bacterium RIFCSPLOWO2_01_FULL_47_10]|nr:MAG: hypothetical protein A3B57_01685 [Microgenomates group bacterium RIFCSPLOWO2_01_FULL_47_10]
MYILPTDSVFNIAILVLLILLLLGLALLLIAIHNFLSKWIGFLQADKVSGATELVDSARRKSLKLVQEANSKAQVILAQAGDISEESKTNIDRALQELATKQEDILNQTSIELKDIGLHTIENAAKEIEKGVLAEVSQFEDIVHKETVESEKLVEEKVNKDYQKVKEEIQKYRDEEMAKIDQSVFNILKDVSTQVLGHALSMEGHRDLVLEALEEAKKRNLFEGKHDDIRR